jgi:hypothetical protein
MEPSSPHPNSSSSYANPSKKLSLKFGKVSQSMEQVASIVRLTTKMHMKKFIKYDILVLGFRRETNWWKLWPIYISREDVNFMVFKTRPRNENMESTIPTILILGFRNLSTKVRIWIYNTFRGIKNPIRYCQYSYFSTNKKIVQQLIFPAKKNTIIHTCMNQLWL